VATAVVALAALLLAPSPALAHGHLTSSTPAAKATLAEAPRTLRLTFSEVPELPVTSLRLLDGQSAQVALSALRYDSLDHHTILADIVGPVAVGGYSVLWQMAGTDGHVSRGTFAFTIAAGATGLEPVAARESTTAAQAAGDTVAPAQVALVTSSGFDASSPAYVVIRWAQFVALLLLIGAVAFRWLVLPKAAGALASLPHEELARSAARIGLGALLLLALTALCRLFAQSLSTHGAAGMMNGAALSSLLTGTVWGHGWILEVVGIVVAAVGFAGARGATASSSTSSTAGWPTARIGVLLLAVVPALSGHAAAAQSFTGVSVLADVFHVLGAGAWLGTLGVLMLVGIPACLRMTEATDRGRATATLVSAFSPLALSCATLLVVTGLFAGWQHLGSLSALWTSPYGNALLRKLIFVVLLVIVAAYNWKLVKPRLGDEASVRRITLSARLELGIALVVLLLTAVLVAMPTPLEAPAVPTVIRTDSAPS
jgi:copper transport protein